MCRYIPIHSDTFSDTIRYILIQFPIQSDTFRYMYQNVSNCIDMCRKLSMKKTNRYFLVCLCLFCFFVLLFFYFIVVVGLRCSCWFALFVFYGSWAACVRLGGLGAWMHVGPLMLLGLADQSIRMLRGNAAVHVGEAGPLKTYVRQCRLI